jgi:hypothetical protein
MAEGLHPDGTDKIIRPAAIDRWPRGIACESSFRILGTPIGFGNARGASLRFLAHVDEPVPQRNSRILTSPFLARAVDAEQRGLDALTLGYDRKIRLGRLDIRLLPSGYGPGAAQLEVSFKDRKIVFSRGVRLTEPLFSPPVEFSKCDLLLLDISPADSKPPSPRRISAQIRDWVAEVRSLNRFPVLLAGSFSAALDTAWTLRQLDIEVRACRSIYEMLQRTEEYGCSMPGLRRLEQQWPNKGVMLHFSHLWPESRLSKEKPTSTAYVGPGRASPKWAEVSFRLGESEDRPGLVSYVRQMGSPQVALGPQCDEATAKLLGKAGVTVYRIPAPTQMPLPF